MNGSRPSNIETSTVPQVRCTGQVQSWTHSQPTSPAWIEPGMIAWYLTRVIADYNRARYLLFPSCGLNRGTKQQYLKSTSGSIHPYPNWLCSKSTMRYYSDTQWMDEWMHDQFLILSWQNPLLIPLYRPYQPLSFLFLPPNSTPDVRHAFRMPLKPTTFIICSVIKNYLSDLH